MQNGGTIELSDVLGPIKTTNNKTLECNEDCRVAERNRRLAIGLQIRNPDLPSKLQPKYSEFIRGWAKKDPKLVTMIHDKLTELVKLAKDSKQRSRSYSFPTMNREKRQLVHEMCEMFGVESKVIEFFLISKENSKDFNIFFPHRHMMQSQIEMSLLLQHAPPAGCRQ